MLLNVQCTGQSFPTPSNIGPNVAEALRVRNTVEANSVRTWVAVQTSSAYCHSPELLSVEFTGLTVSWISFVFF